jgi:putative tryptophan/tyrosine transport system substrate-binding protein
LKVHIVEIPKDERMPTALAKMESERPDALVVTGGLGWTSRSAMMQFAVSKNLPTITEADWPSTFEPYPLLTYSAPWRDMVRSAVGYVDKILKGEKPADLPIQQPSRLQLKINLPTARAIGLAIPAPVLARAEVVVD